MEGLQSLLQRLLLAKHILRFLVQRCIGFEGLASNRNQRSIITFSCLCYIMTKRKPFFITGTTHHSYKTLCVFRIKQILRVEINGGLTWKCHLLTEDPQRKEHTHYERSAKTFIYSETKKELNLPMQDVTFEQYSWAFF